MDIGFAIAIAVKAAVVTFVSEYKEALSVHIRKAGDSARRAKRGGGPAEQPADLAERVRTVEGKVLKKSINSGNIS